MRPQSDWALVRVNNQIKITLVFTKSLASEQSRDNTFAAPVP